MYAIPYPADEALKIYEEREKEIYKTKPFEIKKEYILKGLVDSELNELKIVGFEEEKFKSIFDDLEITVNEDSKNLLIIGELEKNHDMSKLLKNAEKVLAFVYVPDLNDRENIIWFGPNFRVLRTTKQLEELFKKEGFKITKLEALNDNLRSILAQKS